MSDGEQGESGIIAREQRGGVRWRCGSWVDGRGVKEQGRETCERKDGGEGAREAGAVGARLHLGASAAPGCPPALAAPGDPSSDARKASDLAIPATHLQPQNPQIPTSSVTDRTLFPSEVAPTGPTHNPGEEPAIHLAPDLALQLIQVLQIAKWSHTRPAENTVLDGLCFRKSLANYRGLALDFLFSHSVNDLSCVM